MEATNPDSRGPEMLGRKCSFKRELSSKEMEEARVLTGEKAINW